jgi:hypothetical protein
LRKFAFLPIFRHVAMHTVDDRMNPLSQRDDEVAAMTSWTRYPEPMSARRARFEAGRARYHGVLLPTGHPYSQLPLWVPYLVARLWGKVKALRGPVRRVRSRAGSRPY